MSMVLRRSDVCNAKGAAKQEPYSRGSDKSCTRDGQTRVASAALRQESHLRRFATVRTESHLRRSDKSRKREDQTQTRTRDVFAKSRKRDGQIRGALAAVRTDWQRRRSDEKLVTEKCSICLAASSIVLRSCAHKTITSGAQRCPT